MSDTQDYQPYMGLFLWDGFQAAIETLPKEDIELLSTLRSVNLIETSTLHPQVDTIQPVLVLEQVLSIDMEGAVPRRARMFFEDVNRKAQSPAEMLRRLLHVMREGDPGARHLVMALYPNRKAPIGISGRILPWPANVCVVDSSQPPLWWAGPDEHPMVPDKAPL